MNMIVKPVAPEAPTREDGEAALEILRCLAKSDPAAAAALGLSALSGLTHDGALSRVYPADFVADEAYRATLPDLQNGPASLIKGARTEIQHVGISNFRLPIRFHTRGGSVRALGRNDPDLDR